MCLSIRGGDIVAEIDENHDLIHAKYTTGTSLISQREFLYLETRTILEDGSRQVLYQSHLPLYLTLYPAMFYLFIILVSIIY